MTRPTPASGDEQLADAFTDAYWASDPFEDHRISEDRVAAGIAAVRPLIEAEAGNRIADAIEAAALAHHAKDATYSEAYYDGMDDAATIARGETP